MNGMTREKRGTWEVLRHGMTSYFDIDDITIRVWVSSWSGREVVEIDGQAVSDKRSFRRLTVHQFEHGGHRYTVRFIIESILTGNMRCELERDGTPVDSDEFSLDTFERDPQTGRISWRLELISLLKWMAAGAVVGFAVATFVSLAT